MKNLFRLNIKILGFGFGAFLLFSFFCKDVQAADSTAIQLEKEQEIANKAKKKLYPGGADEGELKVQATLTPPKRKISPTLSESAPSEADEAPEPPDSH